MSEEQARQRAQELTKKALAEAENETVNYPLSKAEICHGFSSMPYFHHL